MATGDLAAFMARAEMASVPVARLGVVGGSELLIGSMISIPVDVVGARRRSALEESLAALG
jgi:hypothetical protein